MTFEIEERRAENERHRENSARLAQSFHKLESVGQGFQHFEDALDFGLTFVEEPHVAFGSFLDLDALGEVLDTEPGDDPPIPFLSGVVTEWDQDDRGFYVGAWVAVRVYYPTSDQVAANKKVEMQHFFTFSGIAIKDVPTDVRS